MLQAERLDKIAELVDRQEVVTMEELVNAFKVSKATIRRDIQELDEKGRILRTRGGAMSINRPAAMEPSLRIRSSSNTEEKVRIAREALKYVEYGDRIMLDSGTTVLELSKLLDSSKQLTTVTYDLITAMELAKRNVDLVMVGGALRKNYFSVYGYFAEKMLNDIKVNKAFLAADAIDLQQGLMSYTADDIAIKQTMIRCADEVILLCDHTKFNCRAFISMAPITSVSRIITNREVDGEVVRWLTETGVAVDLV